MWPDNRGVDDGGWQTPINAAANANGGPHPTSTHGQSRINYYHRPEALLRPPEDEPPPNRTPIQNTEPGSHDNADFNPWDLDTRETPGGPEPPNDQAA